MRIILLVIMSLALSFAPKSAEASKLPILTLSKRNTVVLRGAVGSESVAKLQRELLAMSAKLSSRDIIYLVLDTPGGSVSDGLALIDFIHALPQKVKTVTLFAASMGFQIAQNLDERLILPSSTLMSHRASLSGLSGELPGELLSRLQYIMNMLDRMDAIAAKRMGISQKKYSELIRDELWMTGHKSVEMKAADRVILARCDSTFKGSSRVTLGTFLGIPVTGSMSDCPLITGAESIRLEGGLTNQLATEYAQAWAVSRQEVVKKFVCNGRIL